MAKLTGAQVRGATLAKQGALETVVQNMSRPVVFPHFMANGWFVSTNLPKRLTAAGLEEWEVATPLGMVANLSQLALRRLRRTMAKDDLAPEDAALIVAAHGSPSDPRPARATETFAARLRQSGSFRTVRVGYVDEQPSLDEAATVTGPAIVLPFFAARAGHVLVDLPKALKAARYQGTVLPPIGTWPDIPALISEVVLQPEKAHVA